LDKIGYGQDFDGTNDWIDFPSGCHAPTQGTVEMWAQLDGETQTGYYYNRGGAEVEYLVFQSLENTTLRFYNFAAGAAPFVINDAESAVLNQRYLSIGWESGAQNLRTNNVNKGTDNAVNLPDFAYNQIRVGADHVGGSDCDGRLDELRMSDIKRSDNWRDTTYETQNDPASFCAWGIQETQGVVATGADIFYHDGTNNIELQRDDASPVQMFNGTEIIGLKLGAVGGANTSPFHVFDGTNIKAILKMP